MTVWCSPSKCSIALLNYWKCIEGILCLLELYLFFLLFCRCLNVACGHALICVFCKCRHTTGYPPPRSDTFSLFFIFIHFSFISLSSKFCLHLLFIDTLFNHIFVIINTFFLSALCYLFLSFFYFSLSFLGHVFTKTGLSCSQQRARRPTLDGAAR